jgi:hypothetical protein
MFLIDIGTICVAWLFISNLEGHGKELHSTCYAWIERFVMLSYEKCMEVDVLKSFTSMCIMEKNKHPMIAKRIMCLIYTTSMHFSYENSTTRSIHT